MNQIIEWQYTGWEPKDEPEGDDRYYYTCEFMGVDFFIDVYVTDGEITDKTCSRHMGNEALGYLYVSDFTLPESIENDVKERIKNGNK